MSESISVASGHPVCGDHGCPGKPTWFPRSWRCDIGQPLNSVSYPWLLSCLPCGIRGRMNKPMWHRSHERVFCVLFILLSPEKVTGTQLLQGKAALAPGLLQG